MIQDLFEGLFGRRSFLWADDWYGGFRVGVVYRGRSFVLWCWGLRLCWWRVR